jgi:RimJ/RimL family protein N-acetyltransferase
VADIPQDRDDATGQTGIPAAATGRAPVATELRDGTPALIWPLLPTDAAGLRLGFRGLSAESRRSRFLTAVPELSEAMIRRLVDDVDGVHHVALVLTVFPVSGEERLVGVGRLVQSRDDETTADIAITVADAWQGRGVGTALAEALVERRPPAVQRLSTVVSAANTASLRLLARLGPMSQQPAGAGVVEVTVRVLCRGGR